MGEKQSKMTRPETQEEPKPSEQTKPPLHSEVEDDDENVKQLKECSALYLSLQVINVSHFTLHFKFLKPQTLKTHLCF